MIIISVNIALHRRIRLGVLVVKEQMLHTLMLELPLITLSFSLGEA